MDWLQPWAHFLVERTGEESQLIAHGDDRAADGDAVVSAVEHFVQSGRNRDQGLASAGVAVAGDEGNLRIEQRVDQAALAEIERLERLAVLYF